MPSAANRSRALFGQGHANEWAEAHQRVCDVLVPTDCRFDCVPVRQMFNSLSASTSRFSHTFDLSLSDFCTQTAEKLLLM